MKPLLLPTLAAAFACILAAQPHAGFVYPAGARQGATLEIRMGGQFLNGAVKAYISGRGVEVKSVEYVKLPTGKETQFMREEMQQLNEKRAASFKPASAGAPKVVFTDADRTRLDELRDKMEAWQRRQFIPSLADTVVLQLAIAADAPVGPRELRVESNAGLTNPIIFCVGDLPEYTRKPARVAAAYDVVNGGVPIIRTVAHPPDAATEVTLPIVVNAQMMPGTTDQYRFHARKGQHLVVAAAARELIPYVSDAVPGWFQAAITLRDAQGKPLASADHFLFHPDPLLHYEIASDGDYIAEIHDSIFRGREDFVYRMTIAELPVITSIFPLGGKAGTRTAIQATGWNLPAAKLVEDFKSKPAGLYPVSVSKEGVASSPVEFSVDSLPEASAKPAMSRAKAQRIKLPLIVNGRIAHPGDAAYFRFEGQAGQDVVAEVMARRLGSPLDSILRLTDASGKELAFNDDFEDKTVGLLTHQADSFISCKLPAKGTYYLQLADAQHKGGPEYGYRLRVSPPQPDFELRVVPSSFNVRSTVPFAVYVRRRDGFDGDISLKLKDAPANFMLSGAAIPSGQDHVRVTLTVPRFTGKEPLSVQLIGTANVAGHETTRIAVPSEDMEQAFMYHHIVAEDAWLIRIIGTGVGAGWQANNKPVALHSGAATTFEIPVPSFAQNGVQLALNDPPEGITIQKVTPDHGRVSVLVSVQGDKAKPGLKGNLILDVYREVASNRQTRRQTLGTLPAIPFEVIP